MTFKIEWKKEAKDSCINTFFVECGRYNGTITTCDYWNNINAGLAVYNGHRPKDSEFIYFDTEQDYMFFKLRYG